MCANASAHRRVGDDVTRDDLVALCRAAADPELGLVLAGEGNASVATSRGTLLVTASGARLREIEPESVTEIRPEVLLAALHESGSDVEWLTALQGSRVDPDAPRPTVEAGLHAVLAETCGAPVMLHTHPTDVLAVLCSGHATRFARDRLSPDHVVLCGPADCLVPYVDPGRELAVRVRTAVAEYTAAHDRPPRTILLGNHGMVALGTSVRDALDVTMMTVKIARVTVLGGSLGGVRALPAADTVRTDTREDEQYRRRVLAER